MWSQVTAANPPKDTTAARLADDEQVIVVLDSTTGEVRQCGNLSGYCVGMNSWAKPLAEGQTLPLSLSKHAEQLSAGTPPKPSIATPQAR